LLCAFLSVALHPRGVQQRAAPGLLVRLGRSALISSTLLFGAVGTAVALSVLALGTDSHLLAASSAKR
jgi:hypothetical protein